MYLGCKDSTSWNLSSTHSKQERHAQAGSPMEGAIHRQGGHSVGLIPTDEGGQDRRSKFMEHRASMMLLHIIKLCTLYICLYHIMNKVHQVWWSVYLTPKVTPTFNLLSQARNLGLRKFILRFAFFKRLSLLTLKLIKYFDRTYLEPRDLAILVTPRYYA